MDTSDPVIVNIVTPEYKKVIVEASNGYRYYADLSSFSTVYCFPKIEDEWIQVKAGNYRDVLTWPTNFEVHLDQVIGLAYKTERISQPA